MQPSNVSHSQFSPAQEMVLRLLLMSQASDEDTGIHMFRVGALAAMLALATGADHAFAMNCFWAAPLHDLGKVGIPDAILKKRGSLDNLEWRVMRTHPTIGARLLSQSDDPVIELASVGAAAHHERFDGTGYPLGSSAADIPFIGRLIAIVDCYDALRMDRIYRASWTRDAALTYLRTNAGSHFDPRLVAVFIENSTSAEKIIDKINQFPDSNEMNYQSACRLSDLAASALNDINAFSFEQETDRLLELT